MAPVPFGLTGGGGGNWPPGLPASGGDETVERLSGAPACRGPGAFMPASETTGGGSAAAAPGAPSWRGTPGAFGSADGPNASPRRPGGGPGAPGAMGTADATAGGYYGAYWGGVEYCAPDGGGGYGAASGDGGYCAVGGGG